MTRRLDFEPPVQLQVGLGRGRRGDRRFMFKAVSLCAVFGGGTYPTVLSESLPFSLPRSRVRFRLVSLFFPSSLGLASKSLQHSVLFTIFVCSSQSLVPCLASGALGEDKMKGCQGPCPAPPHCDSQLSRGPSLLGSGFDGVFLFP